MLDLKTIITVSKMEKVEFWKQKYSYGFYKRSRI